METLFHIWIVKITTKLSTRQEKLHRCKKSFIRTGIPQLEGLFPEIGASQQFFGALHGELGDVTAHDMGDLAHALLWSQFVDNGYGAFIEDLLVNVVVGIGKSGDLWQVGHTNNLVILREHPQLCPYDLAALSADTGVNFIKNERRRGVG